MKNIIANVGSLMMALLLFTAAGFSQQTVVKVDVPFDFYVGHQTMSAGEYWITPISPSTLAIRGDNNQWLAIALTQPMSTNSLSPKSKLKFEVADGRNILSEVWTDGSRGYKLFISTRPEVVANNQPGTEAQTIPASYVGK